MRLLGFCDVGYKAVVMDVVHGSSVHSLPFDPRRSVSWSLLWWLADLNILIQSKRCIVHLKGGQQYVFSACGHAAEEYCASKPSQKGQYSWCSRVQFTPKRVHRSQTRWYELKHHAAIRLTSNSLLLWTSALLQLLGVVHPPTSTTSWCLGLRSPRSTHWAQRCCTCGVITLLAKHNWTTYFGGGLMFILLLVA